MNNDRALEYSEPSTTTEFEPASKLDWETPEVLSLAITSATEAVVGSGPAPV